MLVDEPLGLYLSKNKTEHTYNQTPEEGLVHLFRETKAKGGTHREIEVNDSLNRAPGKWQDLLSQDYVWKFMQCIEPMGIHMLDRKGDMKLAAFHTRMLGPSGGVSKVNEAETDIDLLFTLLDHILYDGSHGKLCMLLLQ